VKMIEVYLEMENGLFKLVSVCKSPPVCHSPVPNECKIVSIISAHCKCLTLT
jgi:hypothetical protein